MSELLKLWRRASGVGGMMRDTTAFAFCQGLYERLTLGDSFGRTNETSQDWNEAYDRGANLADWLTSERIEAQRAETTQIGSIHESRAEGIAHPHSGPSHDK